LELGARELLTFATVLCGLAGTYAVIKSTVARILEDLKGIQEEIQTLNVRLDKTESGDAVMKHQISVIGNILSPSILEARAREAEALTNRMNACRRDVDTLMHMHNGKHFSVEK
jgi:hypothetical protein